MGRWVQRKNMHQIFLFNPEANRRIGAHHPEKSLRLTTAKRIGRSVERWEKGYKGDGRAGSRPGDGFELQSAALVRVKRIVYEPAEFVYDLGVEGTHSFIADGVVVHNSWDMAYKETKGSDWVVGQCWGGVGPDRYLIDQVRGHWGFTETCARVKGFAEKMRHQYAKATVILVEDKANGPAVIDALASRLNGLRPITPVGSKESRMWACQPLQLGGNLFLPAPSTKQWVDGFIKELGEAPNGSFDDQCDAAMQALIFAQQYKSVPSTLITATATDLHNVRALGGFTRRR